MCSPDQVATQRAITAVDAEKKPHSHQSGRLQCQTVATKTAEQTKTGSVSYNIYYVYCIFLAYNFNSVSNCKSSPLKVSLDGSKKAVVTFRQPGNNIGAALNNLLSTIPDKCKIQFKASSSSKKRLRVRYVIYIFIYSCLAVLLYYKNKFLLII